MVFECESREYEKVSMEKDTYPTETVIIDIFVSD